MRPLLLAIVRPAALPWGPRPDLFAGAPRHATVAPTGRFRGETILKPGTDVTPDTRWVVRVVSTKYDGTLRDTYKAQLLDHIGSTVRLIVPAGTPVYGGKIDRVVEAEDDGIEFYFTDRRYNVSHFHEHTTWPNRWYSNVAAPASFDGDTLRWVDLDIDIRCYLDGSLRALDEDEFERNLVKMTYPDELVRQALAARDEVSGLGRVGEFPFDHETQIADAGFAA